jgi:hypothetical protein
MATGERIEIGPEIGSATALAIAPARGMLNGHRLKDGVAPVQTAHPFACISASSVLRRMGNRGTSGGNHDGPTA